MTYDKSKYFQVIDNGKLKTSEILNACRKQFKLWSYYDDDKLDKDFPPSGKNTTRYFRKNIEADEDLKNLSVNDLTRQGIEGITLRERLILQLQYFKETGSHLDIYNVTLCSGSRYADGDVPDVSWGDGKLKVSWCYVDYAFSDLRSRVAVSLDSSYSKPSDSLSLSDIEIKIKGKVYKLIEK